MCIRDRLPEDTLAQLYDMEADPGEQNNLYDSYPDVAAKMLAQLESDVKRGRSTAGTDQENDFHNIRIWKDKQPK